MNNPRIPDPTLDLDEPDMVEEDLHPYADWDVEQEQGVLVLTHEQLLQRRKEEQAQSRWW